MTLPQHIETALKEFDEKFPQTVNMGHEDVDIEALKAFLSTQLQALAAEMVKCVPPEVILDNPEAANGAEMYEADLRNEIRTDLLKNLSDFIGH